MLFVYRLGVLIGKGTASFARPDVTAGSKVQVGFIIRCVHDFTADDVLNGTLIVVAHSDKNEETILPIWQRAKDLLRRSYVSTDLENAGIDLVIASIQTFSRSNAVDANIKEFLVRAGQFLSRSIEKPSNKTSTVEISPLYFPVGTPSADGSSVVGRDGFLFLTEGRNSVLSRYVTELPQQASLVEGWVALILRRNSVARQTGSRFIQLIVPEKISVLPGLFVEELRTPTKLELRTPTKLLAEIERICEADQDAALPYVSVLNSFSAEPEKCFQTTDSHPSPFGSLCIVSSIIARLDLLPLPAVSFSNAIRGTGDLGRRFFGTPTFEYLPEPSIDAESCLRSKPTTTHFHKPGSGNSDSHVVWINPDPRYDLKVVVFGNSCFAYGQSPSGLSWWFSRLFREVHFLWKSEMDGAYLNDVRPDIVVCQTVERFLFTGAPDN